jgi:hypothetical protein
MKVAVKCESPLLQKSLELFLENYLTPYENCDLIVTDQKIDYDKRKVYISNEADADLVKPFSKIELILALEKILQDKANNLQVVSEIESSEENYASEDKKLDFKFLEDRIAMLTQEYQQNIIKTVRAFYEK